MICAIIVVADTGKGLAMLRLAVFIGLSVHASAPKRIELVFGMKITTCFNYFVTWDPVPPTERETSKEAKDRKLTELMPVKSTYFRLSEITTIARFLSKICRINSVANRKK